jgi:hypothetical protein
MCFYEKKNIQLKGFMYVYTDTPYWNDLSGYNHGDNKLYFDEMMIKSTLY